MTSPHDDAGTRRFTRRAAASALVGTTPANAIRSAPVLGIGAALAAISLTISAGIGLFGHHPGRPASPSAGSPTPSASISATASGPAPSPSATPAPWQRTGVLIVDDRTGARFVYRAAVLRPVRNKTSAWLILGTSSPKTVKIPHLTLAAAPLGAPIGIRSAPSDLPRRSALVHGGWVVCSGPVSPTGAPPERIVAGSSGTLSTSGFTGYGTGLTGGTGLADKAAVVTTNGIDYLIWQHQVDQITDPAKVFKAWKWTGVVPVPVAADVISVLPAGPAISPTALGSTTPARAPVNATTTLCVALTATGSVFHTGVGATVGAGHGKAGLVLAADAGVLVRASSGSKAISLVTGSGIRYPIEDSSARASLGYRTAPIVSVPVGLLNRLPKGPTLSHAVAIAS